MIRNVLVLGGTGFVGRSVCERLVERSGGGGGRIVVPTRRLTNGTHLRSLPTLELVEADVHDPGQLQRLVDGADAVIQLIAILHGSAADFDRAHVQFPRKLAAAKPKRVVHVSALGVGADAPSDYLRSKAAGEQALAGTPLTVIRPSVIFGEHDRFLNVFADIQSLAPVVPLGGGGARFQPVWVEDVASAVVRCLDRDDTVGKTYEAAGPTVYTLSELMRLAGRWAGHERPQIPLPGFATSLQASVMELLPGQPLMSRDNVRSMQVPNVASGQLPGLDALDITPTALEAIAPAYLARSGGRARLDRWRAARG